MKIVIGVLKTVLIPNRKMNQIQNKTNSLKTIIIKTAKNPNVWMRIEIIRGLKITLINHIIKNKGLTTKLNIKQTTLFKQRKRIIEHKILMRAEINIINSEIINIREDHKINLSWIKFTLYQII